VLGGLGDGKWRQGGSCNGGTLCLGCDWGRAKTGERDKERGLGV